MSFSTLYNTENRRLPFGGFSSELENAALIAINDVLAVKSGEQVLIISNPNADVASISCSLFDAAGKAGAKPVLIFQPEKTQMDFADPSVLAAFGSKPEVVISISSGKLGKDPRGIAGEYSYEGKLFDHIFHLQQYGYKCCRAFWSPSVTVDSFVRTVPIDYALLKKRCLAISDVLNRAVAVHISAPAGTDIRVGLKGRFAKSDNGDFSAAGAGGNLPAGETFISPQNGACQMRRNP